MVNRVDYLSNKLKLVPTNFIFCLLLPLVVVIVHNRRSVSWYTSGRTALGFGLRNVAIAILMIHSKTFLALNVKPILILDRFFLWEKNIHKRSFNSGSE